MKPETFRTFSFGIEEHGPHFGYSIAMCDEERDFREKHWDIQPGDVVIDAGASYGAYTLSALAAGAGKVYAFEPEPDVCAGLLANVLLNSWTDRGVVVRLGLWDGPGRVNLHSYAPHWPSETAKVPFEMMRLDDWAARAKLDRLDWLKLDVEGAEVRAVAGALGTIDRFRPRLIIECHTFLDGGIPERIKMLLGQYEWEEFDREPCVMLVGRVRQ